MTVTRFRNNAYTGLSSDTKPTTDPASSTFLETDTGLTWIYNGTTWNHLIQSGTEIYSNKTIDAGSNTIKALGYDAYIYIDKNDSNKIKGRNNRTGVTYSDASNANVVFQSIFNDLNVGNAQSGFHILGGGGSILVGPGTFIFADGGIVYSNTLIQGSGYSTVLKLVNNHADNANATVLRSSTWDTYSYNAGAFTTQQREVGDNGIRIYDLSIDGNKSNNATITGGVNANPNVITGGGATMQQSWGHGIALYGSGNVIRDVTVHDCCGAGFILQSMPMPLDFLGGGNVFGNNLTNVNAWNNNYNGFLIRAACQITNVLSCFNGEGFDVQNCGYFLGELYPYMSGGNIFLDGSNHEPAGAARNTLTYDQNAFQMRITGGNNYVNNVWIEAPYGPGDNLLLGTDAAVTGSTNYTLNTTCGRASIYNCYFDAVRKSAIYIANGSATNQITGARVGGGGGSAVNFEATAVTINGWYNDVDIQGDQLFGNGVGIGTGTAVRMGKTLAVSNCSVEVRFWNVSNLIKWGFATNGNNVINARVRSVGTTAYNVLDPTSAIVDYTNNVINVDYGGSSGLLAVNRNIYPSSSGRIWGVRGGFNAAQGSLQAGWGTLSNCTNGIGATNQTPQFNTSEGNFVLFFTNTSNNKARAGYWGTNPTLRALNPVFKTRFKLPAFTLGNAILYIGFVNISSQPASTVSMLNTMLDTNQGVLFGFRSTDSHYQIMTNNAQTLATYTDTGITPDTNIHTLAIWLNNTAPSINWSFDGAAQTPITDAVNSIPATGTIIYPILMTEAQTATGVGINEHWSEYSMNWL